MACHFGECVSVLHWQKASCGTLRLRQVDTSVTRDWLLDLSWEAFERVSAFEVGRGRPELN